MTVATSRRAMLVGAVSLPALSIPAVAIETDPDAKLIELGKKLEDAWNASEAYRLLDDNEAEWEHLYEKCWDIFRVILKTPAHTVLGMSVKMRSLKYVALEDDIVEQEGAAADFWQSLRADFQQIAPAI
ncbi:MAG: hypothetical protein WCF39_22800 [Pseudolabrys sp.]